MSDLPINIAPGSGGAHGVPPPDAGTPAEIADELVAHALLELHLGADRDDAPRRAAKVMHAIRSGAAAKPSPALPARRLFLRLSLAAVVGLAAASAIYYLGIPGEQSALAAVRSSITAARAAGDRRYEVRVLEWAGTEVNPIPDTIDSRPPGLVCIRHRPPHARAPLTVGRDERGAWAITPEGAVERDRPARFWPPWASLDGEMVIGDSVDRLLEALPKSFTLTMQPRDAADSASAELAAQTGTPRSFDRILATRNDRGGRRPEHVELWIDPSTRLVHRIEFRWSSAQAGDPPDDREGMPPPGREHEHAEGDRPPPPRDHAKGERGERPPPPDGGPPPDGKRPDGPPPDGPRPSRTGRGPGPPKQITFQMVETPTLSADWFSPELTLQR